MSIFGTLGVGRLGLLAQQRAIQTTSNNIANVNTPGYTRQRAVFTAVNPSYLPEGLPVGGGVEVGSVERVANAMIDQQLQQERSAQGFDTSREAGLMRIEGIFPELDGMGIDAALDDLFTKFSELANAPSDPTARQALLESARTVVSLIQDADRRLAVIGQDANTEIEQNVLDINDIARHIAELNRAIFAKEGEGTGAVASSLRDERGQLLEQLAERIDFTSFERDDGQIAVFVGGGFFLVDSEQAAQLETLPSASDPTKLDIFQNVNGQRNGPITSRISSGTLAAALDLRDSSVPSYRDELDALAFSLATRVNAVHYPQPAPALPAGAFGLVDDQQRRFFVDGIAAAVPEGADLAQVQGAASRLAIHADILTDPRNVAAGAESLGVGLGAAASDGRSATAIANLAVTASAMYQVGDVPGTPTGASATLGGFFGATTGRLGAELQSTRRSLRQEDVIIAQLEERRGAISGVSIDEEMANLIRFERAYQASARVIQSADELLSFLMNI